MSERDDSWKDQFMRAERPAPRPANPELAEPDAAAHDAGDPAAEWQPAPQETEPFWKTPAILGGGVFLTFALATLAGHPEWAVLSLIVTFVSMIDRFAPEEFEEVVRKFKMHTTGLMTAGSLVVLFMFPYILTPGCLAPDYSLTEVRDDKQSLVNRKFKVEGTITSVEECPFGIGNDINVYVQVEDKETALTWLVDLSSATHNDPRSGDRVRITGVLQPYGSRQPVFVGWDMQLLERGAPQPGR